LSGDLASLAGGGTVFASGAREKLERLRAELEPLVRRYDVVVANPPYMGSGSLAKWPSEWVKKQYPDEKSDLCTSFIERGFTLSRADGFNAMVTMQSWMFLGSYEKMRGKILRNHMIISMAHLGTRAFGAIGGEVVSTTATVFGNGTADADGVYFRLVDMGSEAEKQEGLLEALADPHCGWFYRANNCGFAAIPGSPIAYWLSERSAAAFRTSKCGDVFTSVGRTKTHNNDMFLRKWWEISFGDKGTRWHPYANGGGFSKWAGLESDLVDWSTNATKEYESHGGLPNMKRCDDVGICWGLITSSKTSFRVKPAHFKYSSGSPTIMSSDPNREMTTLAFLNSSVSEAYLKALNPTLNTTVSDVMSLPCPNTNESVIATTQECINLVDIDWEQYETAWRFKRHPLT